MGRQIQCISFRRTEQIVPFRSLLLLIVDGGVSSSMALVFEMAIDDVKDDDVDNRETERKKKPSVAGVTEAMSRLSTKNRKKKAKDDTNMNTGG